MTENNLKRLKINDLILDENDSKITVIKLLMNYGLVNFKNINYNNEYISNMRDDICNQLNPLTKEYTNKLLKILKKNDLDKYLFVSTGFVPYILFDINSLTLLTIESFSVGFPEMLKQKLDYFKKLINENYNEEHLQKLEYTYDKPYRFLLSTLIKNVQNDKVNVFNHLLELRKSTEFMTKENDNQLIKLFHDLNKNNKSKEMFKENISNLKFDKDDNLIIYRGIGKDSHNGSESLSYTLDKDYAVRLANRKKENGILIIKKINKNDIIWNYNYNNDDSESEILIIPNSGKIIKETQL